MFTLKNVLLVNAVSSGLTGIALAVAPHPIASLLQISTRGGVFGVGVFLLCFAICVYLVSSRPVPSKKAVEWIIVMDSMWVVASLGAVIFRVASDSFLGNFVIGSVALWVGLMVILQYKGLKQAAVLH